MGSRKSMTCGVAAAVAIVVFAVASTHAPDDKAASQGRIAAAGRAALIAAKGEQGSPPAPLASVQTPAGTLRVVQPELVAATYGQPVRFELTLDAGAADGSLNVAIPARWRTRTVSGLVPSRAPRTTRAAQGVALRAQGGAATLRVSDAAAGSRMSFEIVDTGIPASTYRLPVSWTDGSGTRSLGSLEVRFYAPSREAPESQRLNVTNDGFDESETFVSVSPNNTNRVLVGANGGSSDFNAWFSANGGTSFAQLPVPQTLDAPGTTTDEPGFLCCDPFSMADDQGNLWYGGLAFEDVGPSRITVTRIPAGTGAFVTKTVGLPERTGSSGTQDKPMGAIDMDGTSPHYGRLYVVWDEPAGGGINVVITMCDTRTGAIPPGTLNAARCDDADNWSPPVSVTKSTGSYIYPEIAAGPDGKVYVIWWDYSATNAIRGSTCAVGLDCANATNWTTASTIATLDGTGGPVPFACPIVAQPGGRVGPATAMDIDRSAGPDRGTVYVTWSDLRAGSGSTRCDDDGVKALPSNLTWDSFVATASNALPGGPLPSAGAGVRIITEGEAGWPANSDEWFPSVAVDQSTGQAWVDAYSTLEDTTRRTMQVYARPVAANETVGALSKVSVLASDYSNEQCCFFGNDYGDYNGIDAAGGLVFVAWSDKSSADGEAFLQVFPAAAPPPGPPAPPPLPPPPPPPPGPPPPPPPLLLNLPPTASLAAPARVTAGSVSFDASGSSDPDGVIVRFQWDVDGSPTNGYEIDTGVVPRLSRTLAAGSYIVGVRVSDNRGAFAQASKSVLVRPVPRVRLVGNGGRVKVRRGRFSVSLAGCSACTGRVGATTGRRVKVGAATYTLSNVGKVVVTMRVSRAVQRLLVRNPSIRVAIRINVSNGAGGTATASGFIRLHR